jgi:small subunit ribosomal protein S2
MKRERDKLNKTLGGIREMTRTPSAVWIVDTNKEHLAVEEARKLRIPIIGILDSNCDPDQVDFPIPGNDDAIRAVGLLTRVVADAVADGLMARSGARSGDAADASEPLAEWERELLQGDADQAAAQATGGDATTEAPAAEVTGAASEGTDAPAAAGTAAAETAAADTGTEPGTEVITDEGPADTAADAPTEAPAEASADAPADSAVDAPTEAPSGTEA